MMYSTWCWYRLPQPGGLFLPKTKHFVKFEKEKFALPQVDLLALCWHWKPCQGFHIHTQTQTCAHAHTHAHTHTHTHTHTYRKPARAQSKLVFFPAVWPRALQCWVRSISFQSLKLLTAYIQRHLDTHTLTQKHTCMHACLQSGYTVMLFWIYERTREWVSSRPDVGPLCRPDVVVISL